MKQSHLQRINGNLGNICPVFKLLDFMLKEGSVVNFDTTFINNSSVKSVKLFHFGV